MTTGNKRKKQLTIGQQLVFDGQFQTDAVRLGSTEKTTETFMSAKVVGFGPNGWTLTGMPDGSDGVEFVLTLPYGSEDLIVETPPASSGC